MAQANDAPIELSDRKVRDNYEEEQYRQNDPSLETAYEICSVYIPVEGFSERRVWLSLNEMLAAYNLNLAGIDIRKAINDIAYKGQLSNAWRYLILEGKKGFLELGILPDTVDHPDVRQGYVLVYFMYLPKRGKIFAGTDAETRLLGSHLMPDCLPDGTILGFNCPYYSLPDPSDSAPDKAIYIPYGIRYAVVISQSLLRHDQSVPIIPAEINYSGNNSEPVGRALFTLAHGRSADARPVAICADSFAAKNPDGWRQMARINGEISLFKGNLEVISIYDPAIFRTPAHEGFAVGRLTDTALADIQRYYNANKASAVRIILDRQYGEPFRYDGGTGKYYDDRGHELTDDYSSHAGGYITLLFVS